MEYRTVFYIKCLKQIEIGCKPMTEDYIEQRRRYVQQIRESFQDEASMKKQPAYISHSDWEKEEADTVGSAAFWKVKVILSVMLFAAFVFCDRTDVKLFQLSPQTITEKIQENNILPKDENWKEQVQTFLENNLKF